MKKFIGLVSAIFMIFVLSLSVSAITAGSSVSKAYAIDFGEIYSESITETSKEDYYKMTLPSSGNVSIAFTSYMQYYCVYIYNSDGEEVWYTNENEWVSTTGMRKDTHKVNLEKGTYYLKVTGYYWGTNYPSTGNYNFTVEFVASGANIAEPNNNIAQAKTITLGNNVKGQIAVNDREDYYKFTLASSGRVDLSIASYMQYYCVYIYNSDGEEVWYTDENEWVSTTGMRKDSYAIDLEKGTYYLKTTGYYWDTNYPSTGNYNFTAKFTASAANIAEPNNSIAEAKKISYNSNVKGQIAVNDREDYYKLTLSEALQIDITFTSYMQYYCIYIYNSDGEEIWYTDENEWVSTTQKRKDTHSVNLEKGTYYLKITGYYWDTNYPSTGNYNFTVKPIINIPSVSNIKKTSTTSKIKLTWSKILGADGYIVYRYNSSSKKYVKVATTTSTSYELSSLKAGTACKFKIKAYRKAYGTMYYSSSVAVSTATKPGKTSLTNVKASDTKIVTQWKKASGASGYQVVYSTSSKFKNKTSIYVKGATSLKKTLKELQSGKTYYVKVRAYKSVSGLKVYGEYSAVKKITTKPARVSLSHVDRYTNKVVVNWYQAEGASGYQVTYSTSSDFKNKKTITVKGATSLKKTLKGLGSRKNYYVKVRAYKSVNDTKVYGEYCSVVKVTTK